MNRTGVLFVVASLALSGIAPASVDVLMMVPHRYGANYNFTRDRLESYGWNVVTAGVTEIVEPCYPGLPDLHVDTLISGIPDLDFFEAIVICPATWRYQDDPYGDLIASAEAVALLQEAVASEKPVWAACAGPRVLAAADLLEGVSMQGVPGSSGEFLAEYLAAGAVYLGNGLPPVICGPVITVTRDQYYQSENCEAIGTVLASYGNPDTSPRRDLVSSTHDTDGTEWSVTFGGSDSDGGRALCETSDGGFLVAGYTYSCGAGWSDVLLVRTDSDGGILWSKTAGGSGWDCGNSIMVLPDGGFVVAGSTTSAGAGGQDAWLAKFDEAGDMIWEKTYGGTGVDAGMSVCAATDGGLLLCGYTESSGAGGNDVFLVRTDSSGDVIWEKTYGGAGPETGDCAIPSSNGGFVVAGSTGSFTANRDAFLIEIDQSGEILWSDYYGATGGEGGYDRACSLCPLACGGYAMAGESNGEDNCGAFLVRTDAQGVQVFSECYGGSFYDYGRAVLECSDGGLLVCGSTKDHDTCMNDIYVLKTSPEGAVVWESAFGSPAGSEWGCAVCATSDGGYAVLGQTGSFGAGGYDAWLFKITDPSAGCETAEDGCGSWFDVTPNPASGFISLADRPFQSALAQVFDMAGRLTDSFTINQDDPSLDISDLAGGVYLLRLVSGGNSAGSRFVVLR